MGRGNAPRSRQPRAGVTTRTLRASPVAQRAAAGVKQQRGANQNESGQSRAVSRAKRRHTSGKGNDYESLAADYLRSAMLGQGPGETNSFTPRDMERVERELKLIEKLHRQSRA